MRPCPTTPAQRPAGGTAAPLDVARLRQDFPILKQTVHGRPLVYLDNAATTQKPQAVIDAVSRFYERDNANIHRGVHELSLRSTQAYEAAREAVRRFIGAARTQEIVFVRGATEAINLVAQSYGRPRLRPGDEVLISTMEHHSNIVPWQIVCQQTGARLRVIPISDRGELLLDQYERLLNPRTRLVAIVHVSNALGTVNPVREMTEIAHRQGVPVLVDGAQSVAHMSVDVSDIGCDFFVFSGHKVFGPTGIGALYARQELLEQMPPYQGGGDMIASVTFEETTYNVLPQRFEAGTPNVAGAIGLAAALDYVQRVGPARIAAHERELLRYATQGVQQLPRVRLIGTAAEKAAILSFVIDGIHPHDAGTVLDRLGIAVRSGHHCAQPLMRRLGLAATVRASLAFYNTREELDALLRGVRRVIEVLG